MPDVFNAQENKPNQPAPTYILDGEEHSVGISEGTLGSMLVKPKNIVFETQEPGEKIVIFLRQHFIVNVHWIVATIILLLAPQFIFWLLTNTNMVLESVPDSYFLVMPLLWYLGTFGYAFTNFLHWYFNIYIVTNERVVDIDWINLLYKQISSAKLNKIEDVTARQGGVAGAFFDYGNVHIQTAGTETNFEFISIPKPNLVVKQINELIS